MKRFLWRLAAFLGIPAILFAVYPSEQHPYVVNRRTYVERLRDFEARPGVERVILGDSHAEALPQDLLVPQTFNLAEGGDGLSEMLVKAAYALERSPDLQLALVSCDYHMCARHKLQSPKRTFLFPFIPPELRGEVYDIGELERRLVSWDPIFDGQLYTFERERLKAELRRFWLGSTTSASAGGRNPAWFELTAGERTRRARGTGALDYKSLFADPRTTVLYREIVQRLRRNGVRVIGLRFPVDRDYLAEINAQDRARVEALQESLGFERIVDYKDLTQDPRDFADPDHLSRRGALLLLDRLRQDLAIAF